MQVDKETIRYFNLMRSIPKDEFHEIHKFAPNNPIKFIHYLKQLPTGGYEIDYQNNTFKIIGIL